MKALFLNPPSEIPEARDLFYGCWCNGKRIAWASFPPLNLLYPATLLNDNGHTVRLLDAQAINLSVKETLDQIKKYGPDLLIMAMDHHRKTDCKLMAAVKREQPGLKTAVFGAWPTFSPGESIHKGGIDYAISGEPELSVLKLAELLQKNAPLPGKIAISNEVADLDTLPLPDRQLLPHPSAYYNPLVTEHMWTTALTSRGCPYNCTFCTSHQFYQCGIRQRSAKNVVEELAYLQDLGYKEIFFRDELLTWDKKRTVDICTRILRERIDLKWIANAHVNHADLELLKIMKKAGCTGLKFGVESGEQRILDYYKKTTTIAQIKKSFRNAQFCGIRTHAHFILGGPKDNRWTLLETIKLANDISPTTATFNPLRVLEGTKLHAKKVKPMKNAASMVRYAYKKFYLRPEYIIQRLSAVNNARELLSLLRAGRAIATLGDIDTGWEATQKSTIERRTEIIKNRLATKLSHKF